MMPDDVDKDTKLPVIFWMHGGVMLQVINNIKSIAIANCEQGYVVVNVNYAFGT